MAQFDRPYAIVNIAVSGTVFFYLFDVE